MDWWTICCEQRWIILGADCEQNNGLIDGRNPTSQVHNKPARRFVRAAFECITQGGGVIWISSVS